MDRGAQWAIVYRVTKSRTWLSNFSFLSYIMLVFSKIFNKILHI